MDVRQLKFFLAVVDFGGFSKAAEQLLVAQPSLSQAIAGFERELGMPLFHRVGRGVVLSEAGEALVGPARVVLRDVNEAAAAMRALKGLRGGRLDLIAMPSPGMEPLTTILTAFVNRHPDVMANVEAGFTPEEVLHSVRSGSCEIGILGSPAPIRAPDLDVVALEAQALVLISGPDESDLDGPTVSRDDLKGCRLIVSQRGSLMRALVDDVLAEGIDVTIVAEIAHRTSILPMVLNGLGRAVMPSSWTQSAERAGAKVQRIVPESYLQVAAVSRRSHLTAPAKALMDGARRYSRDRSQPPGRKHAETAEITHTAIK
jgi:DNA-binding transcriptional LysR family regulator